MRLFIAFTIFLFGMNVSTALADEILFHNGDLLKGTLRQESPHNIVFDSINLGALTISKDLISKMNITQDDIKQEPEEKKPKIEWKREVEGSYNLKRGNTETDELGGKLFINRKREKIDEWTAKGRAYYSSAGKKMNAQQYYGLARYAWSFGKKKKWYHYTKGEGEHDRFANIDGRYTPSTGIGYWFSDKEPFKALLEAGPGVEWTHYRQNKSNTTEVILSSRAYFEWIVFDKCTLSEEFIFYPFLTDFGEFRFRSETSLKVPLYYGISLRFNLVDEYQSNPGADTEKNDLRLETGMAYTF